jgi:hypothetical protein
MTTKDRALQWANTFFAQKEASIYHNLEIAVKHKDVGTIISLSDDLGALKEDKAEMVERIQDADDIIELLEVISLLKCDREDEVCFVTYIFEVQASAIHW